MIKDLYFKKYAPDLATPETIAALEAKLNLRFPPAFVEFCMRWNGGFTNRQNKFYPVPLQYKEYYDEYGSRSGGDFIDTLFGATEKFEHCSVLKEYRLLNESTNRGVIPISANLFGNRAILRLESPDGPVYWWDHELWESAESPGAEGNFEDRPRLIPIAPDLEYFYNSLTISPFR